MHPASIADTRHSRLLCTVPGLQVSAAAHLPAALARGHRRSAAATQAAHQHKRTTAAAAAAAQFRQCRQPKTACKQCVLQALHPCEHHRHSNLRARTVSTAAQRKLASSAQLGSALTHQYTAAGSRLCLTKHGNASCSTAHLLYINPQHQATPVMWAYLLACYLHPGTRYTAQIQHLGTLLDDFVLLLDLS